MGLVPQRRCKIACVTLLHVQVYTTPRPSKPCWGLRPCQGALVSQLLTGWQHPVPQGRWHMLQVLGVTGHAACRESLPSNAGRLSTAPVAAAVGSGCRWAQPRMRQGGGYHESCTQMCPEVVWTGVFSEDSCVVREELEPEPARLTIASRVLEQTWPGESPCLAPYLGRHHHML